jgi:hypothetical protein
MRGTRPVRFEFAEDFTAFGLLDVRAPAYAVYPYILGVPVLNAA